MMYGNGSTFFIKYKLKSFAKRLTTTMSFVSTLNGTTPVSDAWTHVQDQFKLNTKLTIFLLLNAPIIAIVVNVVRQLVATTLL